MSACGCPPAEGGEAGGERKGKDGATRATGVRVPGGGCSSSSTRGSGPSLSASPWGDGGGGEDGGGGCTCFGAADRVAADMSASLPPSTVRRSCSPPVTALPGG